MSNTGQIKRYDYVGDNLDGIEPDDNGEFVKYDDHVSKLSDVSSHLFDLEKMLKSTESSLIYSTERAETLTRDLSAAEQRIADQLKLIEVAGKRIDELELALLYYADEGHFKHGDVSCHIYALDDAGHIARNALGIDQKEVDRRVLATYYTE